MLDEKEIKARVLSYLLSLGRIKRGALIANEFVIAGSSVRADLAILSDAFVGVEVKSGRDSLKRLSTQIAGYRYCFDSVIIVLAEKHLKSFPINDHPGVEVLQIDDAGLIGAVSSPVSAGNFKPSSLYNLLTQVERRRYFKKDVDENASLFDDVITSEQMVLDAFKAAFSARFKTTSDEFWSQIGRRKIRAVDLEILSRFRAQREAVRRWQSDREQQNQNWISKLHMWQNSLAETI